MTSIDPVALRIHVYDEIIARGVPPTLAAIAEHFGVARDVAKSEIADLRVGKTILPDPESGEIWMAGPFSSTKTAYRLERDGRVWWANCAWDMFGVAMIVNEPLQCQTTCTDCGAPISIRCDPKNPPLEEAVVHFLVPARKWYDDIGFT